MVTKKSKVSEKKVLAKVKSKKKAAVKEPAPLVKVAPELEVQAVVQPPVLQNFVSAVGRRKSAKARVRMTETGQGLFVVNGRELKQYFAGPHLVEMVLAPLKATGQDTNHDFSVKVVGGGVRGQAEAVRHGLARIVVKWNSDFKKTLKKTGFLTRDSREKERKKPGLKRARKAPQWSKR